MRARIHSITTWLIVGLLSLGMTTSVWAAAKAGGEEQSQRVFDEAQLFTTDEIAAIEANVQALRNAMKMDVVVVTTGDTGGKDAQSYADDYYDYGGFGTRKDESGVLFLIDMDNRQLCISTFGTMIRFLTDQRIEKMLDSAYTYAQSEDYAGAMNRLILDMDSYYKKGIPGGQYTYDTETGTISRYRRINLIEALAAFGAAAFTAVGACANVKRQYGMKQERGQAAGYHMAYRADAQFAFRNQNDVLANSFVTQRVIPRQTSGSSRGGGGIGGGMSSGRSSTHRSSSGRSHGGGSRRF